MKFQIYDVENKAGTFKRCPMDVERPHKSQDGTLGAWLMWLPGWSPAWDNFILSVVHLRPIPGERPAIKKFPEATHELILAAIDPEHPADWRNIFKDCKYLTPLNVIQQFVVSSDANAVLVCEALAQFCIRGHLPIEPQGITGALDFWKKVTESTAKKVEAGEVDENGLVKHDTTE